MSNEQDTIYRQAAIDAIAELQGRASSKGELTGISKAWKKIKALPSAQPEIVRCKYCKWYGKVDKMFYRKNTCTNPRVQMKPSPMDYCSCGERRTDG